MGKDASDAYQLRPLAPEYALVASEMASADALFDHQSRPVPAEADTVDLALDITQGGSYVLEASAIENLPPDWKVILRDSETGARWDLGAGQAATFSVEATGSKAAASSATRSSWS